MSVITELKKLRKLQILKKKWKKINIDNETYVEENIFSIDDVHVGRGTYGPINMIWMAKDAEVYIGDYCSIGPKVKFLVGGEHNYHRISTFPFQTKIYNESTRGEISRNIVIEDDVWIGYDSLIMSGVTIGKGSVIGARSVVAKDVPPYSIFVGNKVIKKRFSDDIIQKLEKINFNSISHEKGDLYQRYCQVEINEENINEVMTVFVN